MNTNFNLSVLDLPDLLIKKEANFLKGKSKEHICQYQQILISSSLGLEEGIVDSQHYTKLTGR